jgi:hypothetical protein
MTINLTFAQVREAMAAAVAERGADYDYKAHHDSCRYTFWRDTANGIERVPGCLVGDVMHRLGVPLDVLDNWNDAGAETLLDHLTDPADGRDYEAWVTYADAEAAEHTMTYLCIAQNIQDLGGVGHTWGDAYRLAEGRYTEEQGADQ